MVPESKIDEFVLRLRTAAGENLASVILYGSAVTGDFHAKFSNLNLLCVVRDSSFAALQAATPVVKWWARQKQTPPIVMTVNELQRSADTFAIELMDMQQHHRVLFGEDPLLGLQIAAPAHRMQVKYELREKLILLRQQAMLAADSQRQLWQLLLRSLPSILTLFRHALMVMGHPAPAGRREVAQSWARHPGLDTSVIGQLLDVRERKAEKRNMNVHELCARYLALTEQITVAVDQRTDTDGVR